MMQAPPNRSHFICALAKLPQQNIDFRLTGPHSTSQPLVFERDGTGASNPVHLERTRKLIPILK
jgi:hypothetical protein